MARRPLSAHTMYQRTYRIRPQIDEALGLVAAQKGIAINSLVNELLQFALTQKRYKLLSTHENAAAALGYTAPLP